MITGRVNWFLEPFIPVDVQSAKGSTLRIQCLLDTGFDGELALPSAAIRQLVLDYVGPSDTTMFDGNSQSLPIYDGTVVWLGETIRVSVLGTGRDAIIGTGLLENSTLTVQVWDGGTVTIEPR